MDEPVSHGRTGERDNVPISMGRLAAAIASLDKSGEKGAERRNGKLPHSGASLREMVSVIVKTARSKSEPVDVRRLLHQARVRRHVVVSLNVDAVARGHPAFQGLRNLLQR